MWLDAQTLFHIALKVREGMRRTFGADELTSEDPNNPELQARYDAVYAMLGNVSYWFF